MSRPVFRPVLWLPLFLLAATSLASGASRVLPGLRFRVLHTAHFRIYYHQHEERLARSLAQVAESVRATVPARLGLSAPEITHVLLVDQDDAANGWATPLPYDTVMVTAAWPAPSEIIGNTSDWLRLVFTHEFTHVLQLHQSRGWARAVRSVFGRAPLAFPNLFLPLWATEGLATFEETRETGAGRLAGGDSRAVVYGLAREIGREPLDRVGGGQVAWPGGLGPYLYGGFFMEYLARRFGEQKLGEVVRRTAGRLPYLGAPAFRGTFGEGLGTLWGDFQRSLVEAGSPGLSASAPRPLDESRRITRDGYYVTSPRFTPDGRHLVYAVRNADDFPALLMRNVGGGTPGPGTGSVRKVATRYGGEQLSVSGGTIYFDQADYEVNVAWRSDLYAADLATGRVQRLTHGARLLAPDVSPDGRRLACLKVVDGERRLVVFDVTGDRVGALAVAEASLPAAAAGVVFGSPRWAPDGARIAVERRVLNGPSEIAVIDVRTGEARVAASSPAARNITPAWLPDGRSILFASDREGGAFQLYVASLETGETARALSVAGGALAPAVSPDGRRVVFVGYTAAGYDLFDAPLPAPEWGRASVPATTLSPVGSAFSRASQDPPRLETPQKAEAVDRPYHPLVTLLPRSWTPAADTADNQLRVGLSTGGLDVLGRHGFGVTALWRLQAGSDAMFGPHRARPDWNAFYAYDRWRPAFFVTGSDKTSFLPQFVRGGRVADAELREVNASIGVSLPFLRLPYDQLWQTAFNVQRNTLASLAGERRYARNAIQTAWAFNSAHVFGYSISPEQGASVGLTSEQVRSALGADGDADAFTAEVRGYVRLGGRHSVLAGRAAVGVATGDANVARIFFLGGPQPVGSLIDFGSDAFSMLRGYEYRAFAASHVAAANLEYRFPLWRIERGRGTWPIFLRTVHAAVFADAGQVWDDKFTWNDAKAAVGAEVSLDTIIGFGLPVTLSAGVAMPSRPGGSDRPSAYLRLGRAF